MAKPAAKEMSLSEVENLVESNPTKYWWEGWVLNVFTQGRGSGIVLSKKAVYNPRWTGNQKWGFVRRVSVTDRGTYFV